MEGRVKSGTYSGSDLWASKNILDEHTVNAGGKSELSVPGGITSGEPRLGAENFPQSLSGFGELLLQRFDVLGNFFEFFLSDFTRRR
jgi:hypothetical protein